MSLSYLTNEHRHDDQLLTEAAITSYGDIIVLSEDAIKALNTTELKVAMTAVDTKTTKATKAAVPQV
jgi:hypothetical protein